MTVSSALRTTAYGTAARRSRNRSAISTKSRASAGSLGTR
jgi:hypothetical protein